MKIKLSKSRWEGIGKRAGWMKIASDNELKEYYAQERKNKEIIKQALPNIPTHFQDNKWFLLGALWESESHIKDEIDKGTATPEEARKAWDIVYAGSHWAKKVIDPNYVEKQRENRGKWRSPKSTKPQIEPKPIDTYEHMKQPFGERIKELEPVEAKGDKMKIKLSKNQWEGIGKQAGWMKKEAALSSPNIIIDLQRAIQRLTEANQMLANYQKQNGAIKSKEQFASIFSKMPGIVTNTKVEDWIWSQVDPTQTRATPLPPQPQV